MESRCLLQDLLGQTRDTAHAIASGASPCHDGGQVEGEVGVELQEVVTQELQAVYDDEAGHGAVAHGLAGRLRRILLKLRKPAGKPVQSGGASPPQEQSRSVVKGKIYAAPAPGLGVGVTAGVDRRARLKAVVKYLRKITTHARCRRGGGPDLSATGRSRASSGKGTGNSRSSVAAAPPRRSDDSMLQLQDGIENAIAHCKRSLDASFA